MYTIKNYIMAQSLEEASALKKKSKNNVIIGGNLWLKMGKRNIQNAIDLSQLQLDRIEEDEEGFLIGCMVSLRSIEVHEGLNKTFGNIFEAALKHIVGVQFRNCATVGGSIFPRFGFSDVLSVFMACDTYVDLYEKGRVPLKEFVRMPVDQDILTHVYVKKDQRKTVYKSFRMTKTDFPTLTCAVSKQNEEYAVVLGARPYQAEMIEHLKISDVKDIGTRKLFAKEAAEQFRYADNIRGSAEYRCNLAEILIRRCVEEIEGIDELTAGRNQ